jgi:hypothetical protein
MKFRFFPAALAGAALLLTACDPTSMVDSSVQKQMQQYFPAAEISHPRRNMLVIQTHVSNITELFAAEVMKKVISDHGAELGIGMPFGGYTMLAVMFEGGGTCEWVPSQRHFICFTAPWKQGDPVRTYQVWDNPMNPQLLVEP